MKLPRGCVAIVAPYLRSDPLLLVVVALMERRGSAPETLVVVAARFNINYVARRDIRCSAAAERLLPTPGL